LSILNQGGIGGDVETVIAWNFELDMVVNCNVREKGVVGNGELCGASVWDV